MLRRQERLDVLEQLDWLEVALTTPHTGQHG